MEKSDKLEKLIQDKRSELDTREPRKGLWTAIESRMGLKSTRFTFLWKAAAIIFFMLSVYLIFDKYNYMHPVKSEFATVEDFYMGEIGQKIKTINYIAENERGISAGAEQDLYNLDAMYQVLKEELKKNPSKKVVDALTLNLLIRIDILNEELRKLEKDDSEENGKTSEEEDKISA